MSSSSDKEKRRLPLQFIQTRFTIPNIQEFLILILVNAFVGAMIGLERTCVPLIGKNVLGMESNA